MARCLPAPMPRSTPRSPRPSPRATARTARVRPWLHPARILPESRRCLGTNFASLQLAIPDTGTPLPTNGTQNELYSKHGLGLALLVLAPFEVGGRTLVVFFLNALGALLAANIYLL